MTGRVGPRIAMASAVATMVIGALGLIVTLVLGAFVFDDYDATVRCRFPEPGGWACPRAR